MDTLVSLLGALSDEVTWTSGGEQIDAETLRRNVALRAADLASHGARAGQLVAIAMTEPVAALTACFAAWQIGAAVAPLPSGTRANDPRVAQLRPALFVGATIVVCNAPRLLDGGFATTRLVLHTSGSRGVPKLVALSESGLLANIEAIVRYFRPMSRVGIVLPLHYGYALVGQVLTALRAQASLFFVASSPFIEDQLFELRGHNVDTVSGVTWWFNRLADAALLVEPARRPPLSLLGAAGGRLDLSTAQKMLAAFPGAVMWNQYGLTEASPRVSAVRHDEPPFFAGSIGRPLHNLSTRITDEEGREVPIGSIGELRLRGPSVMLGYLDQPNDTTLFEGELCSHDLVHQDANGYLYFHGRKDDIVKVAGERISVDEVTLLLSQQPLVSDAQVVALVDANTEYRLVAFFCGEADERVLRQTLRAALGPAKTPARFIRLDTMPRLGSGKIDVPNLRDKATTNGDK